MLRLRFEKFFKLANKQLITTKHPKNLNIDFVGHRYFVSIGIVGTSGLETYSNKNAPDTLISRRILVRKCPLARGGVPSHGNRKKLKPPDPNILV